MTEQPTVTIRDRLVSLAVIGVVILGVWWFLFGRGDPNPGPPEARTATSYAEEYGGEPGRWQSILDISDCATLGRMFDDGKTNFDNDAPGGRDLWRGQMAVSDDRMDELGCP